MDFLEEIDKSYPFIEEEFEKLFTADMTLITAVVCLGPLVYIITGGILNFLLLDQVPASRSFSRWVEESQGKGGFCRLIFVILVHAFVWVLWPVYWAIILLWTIDVWMWAAIGWLSSIKQPSCFRRRQKGSDLEAQTEGYDKEKVGVSVPKAARLAPLSSRSFPNDFTTVYY
jgi:hypothetical protein